MPLFEVPYYIFGQKLATEEFVQRIMSRLLFSSPKPLVLFLTGLSGHGKTELARRMGSLLSLDLITVDCTMMKHDTDLLGPWPSYEGYEIGTQLNNYLAKWDGKRTVVFLDEFDKTTEDVRQAMLLLFESGLYTDRRYNTKVDCAKVIWILAANLAINEITKYWVDNLRGQMHQEQKGVPKDLKLLLKKCTIKAFGAPLAGRLPAIIPFTPFDEGERAVTAYKFMRDLWHDVRKPIDTEDMKFAGNSFVNYVNDGQIATHIARRYLEKTGARSLADVVEEEITNALADEYYKTAGEVKNEMNAMPLPNSNVRVVGDPDGNDEYVEVVCMGTKRPIQR